MESSLVLIKPDGVQRGLTGEIITRFERKGLKLAGLKMVHLKDAVLREHYAHVIDEPFFEELSYFMSSSPLVALCLEGIDAVEVVRKICGIKSTEFGSIRGDFSLSPQRNLVHSSDSAETAKREIERFFTKDEMFEYDKDEWKHVYSESEKQKIKRYSTS